MYQLNCVNVCTIFYRTSDAVNPLSVSDCLSVCVINMYCIWVQCILLSVSVRLSVFDVCTVVTVSLFCNKDTLFIYCCKLNISLSVVGIPGSQNPYPVTNYCFRTIIFYLSLPRIEPRLLDLQANTLPRRCRSRLLLP